MCRTTKDVIIDYAIEDKIGLLSDKNQCAGAFFTKDSSNIFLKLSPTSKFYSIYISPSWWYHNYGIHAKIDDKPSTTREFVDEAQNVARSEAAFKAISKFLVSFFWANEGYFKFSLATNLGYAEISNAYAIFINRTPKKRYIICCTDEMAAARRSSKKEKLDRSSSERVLANVFFRYSLRVGKNIEN